LSRSNVKNGAVGVGGCEKRAVNALWGSQLTITDLIRPCDLVRAKKRKTAEVVHAQRKKENKPGISLGEDGIVSFSSIRTTEPKKVSHLSNR